MHSSVIGMQSSQQERRGIVITFSRGIVGDGGREIRRACFAWDGGVVDVAADARAVEVEVEVVVLKDEPDV